MKILIVDDVPANLYSLRDILTDISMNKSKEADEEASLEILQATSGDEALKILLRSDDVPFLAILDVQMPIMDGYQLAEIMRTHPRMRYIPIIFLSAIYSEEQYIFRGYESGGVDFLTKPLDINIFRSKVDVFLNLARYRVKVEQAHLAHEKLIIKKAKERELLQEQLYRAQKLQGLGQLTSGIAHDFNNVLMCILGHTELAKMYLQDTPNPDIEDSINQIQIAGNRAINLIKQMLAYTRQKSTMNQLPSSIQVLDVIEEVLALAKTTLLRSRIQLETRFAENIPTVLMDPTELHQVVMNLMINAIDSFNGEAGVIKLVLDCVEFSENTLLCSDCFNSIQGHYIEISIADTGMGINPSELDKIFDPFFTTKSVDKGTGLGLSVVSGLVHGAHGHILIESELGKGTRFRILLPIETN
jgi:signal transduction histidine kinase